MTWIKLDANTPHHPKVSPLSDKAFRGWVAGLCYAGEFLTDGVLPVAFLKTIKRSVQDEILDARLWKVRADGTIEIHDYLHHQTRKEDVEYEKERNRAKAAAYRARKRAEKSDVTVDVTGDALPKSDHVVPNPDTDNRLQITDNRGQRQKNGHAAAPLITSPLEYERRKQQCVYVGARLEVPHGLHADLRKLLGGLNAETDLLAWYADLDEEIEASGETITPDIFKWLKARYATWAAKTNESVESIVARIEAKRAARGLSS